MGELLWLLGQNIRPAATPKPKPTNPLAIEKSCPFAPEMSGCKKNIRVQPSENATFEFRVKAFKHHAIHA
jgi:hypothetical protein